MLDPVIGERVLVIAASLGNNVIGRLFTRKLAVAILKRFGAGSGGSPSPTGRSLNLAPREA